MMLFVWMKMNLQSRTLDVFNQLKPRKDVFDGEIPIEPVGGFHR